MQIDAKASPSANAELHDMLEAERGLRRDAEAELRPFRCQVRRERRRHRCPGRRGRRRRARRDGAAAADEVVRRYRPMPLVLENADAMRQAPGMYRGA